MQPRYSEDLQVQAVEEEQAGVADMTEDDHLVGSDQSTKNCFTHLFENHFLHNLQVGWHAKSWDWDVTV